MKPSYILLAFLLLQFACTTSSEPPAKPNFLFILVDDLGAQDLACTGSQYYETPNIDRIAQRGITFNNAYATCAVCSPSRASIMSGRFPARHGITDYIGAKTDTAWRSVNRHTVLLPTDYTPHLPHDYKTLPEALKTAAYRTFFAGKWHLGSAEQSSLPTDHGFDYNRGGYHLGGPYSGGFFSPFNNPFLEDHPGEKGMSLSMKLAKETNQFISENRDTNFFAMLSFYAVHAPIQTTKARWEKYRDKAAKKGIDSVGFEMERILPIRKHQDNPVYAGLVEQVDDAVGAVLDTLERLGLAENTVIIFTSDNGGVASGDHYATNNGTLRGGKGYQWEGGLRVPALVYVPWLETQNKLEDSPVSGADWYPTILELAGLPLSPDEHLDGQSILPLLKGNALPERPLFWHYPHYGNQGGEPHAIIRQGDWKLIHYWEDRRNELYDLGRDPGEKKDLSSAEVNRAIAMQKTLLAWLDEAGARYPRTDSLRDEAAAAAVLEYNRGELKERLERQRRAMYEKDWQPNADWWGSTVSNTNKE